VSDLVEYSAPVPRRWSLLLIVGGVLVAAAVGTGVWIRSSALAEVYLTAVAISFIALAAAILVVLVLFMPTRIEIHPGEVQLVAPRTVTRYVPGDMLVRRSHPGGLFSFERRQTGRVLARFQPPDPEAAIAAFTTAGVEVVS
jgi:hypothetical protein